MTHLVALQNRLSNEKAALANAKTENERQLRAVWIAQIEKEIEAEWKFIGVDIADFDMLDDELLAELAK